MKTQDEKIYISFPTSRVTSNFLKMIANKMGKTQPELINEICEEYIVKLLDVLEEKGLTQI